MVGSVLVYKDQIIGQGYHHGYGQSHAERNSIDDALRHYPNLVKDATLYVTLEPCFHQGKTPPCVQYILKHQIKKVVIGITDPNPLVGGQSINLMKENGIEVKEGILEKECNFLIRKFLSNLKERPYIILKFAQSYDEFMGQKEKQVWLSNKFSKIIVHKWRSEVEGIMVGTQTVLTDNPQLSTREWYGDDPVRIIPDLNNRIQADANIFSAHQKTILLKNKESQFQLPENVKQLQVESNNIESYWNAVYNEGIYSILVEGGQMLINSILDSGLWDEARIIKTSKRLHSGIKAPSIKGFLYQKQSLSDDLILTILNDRS
ncbi:UNVERIFIED_CONTAM: hypothetical protein GTU68_051105 [Idotea baltica]|nr:hypothetical protein [Idotea baltica]